MEITFKDTMLQFPSSLAGYGDSLNAQFNTDRYTKLDLGGGYTRSELYETKKELEDDGNELDYLDRDVTILVTFMEVMNEVVPIKK